MIVNTLIVMAGVLLSRVLGLIRDATIYSRFAPPNPKLDAYLAAFRIPDFLYAVIIGGALATTLIPVFQQVWHEEGEERAWDVANAVLTLALLVLSVLLLLVAVCAAPLTRWLYPTVGPEQQQLTTTLTRLFLFSPLFLGLGGIAMGLLNARDRFGAPSLAFNIYNLLIIAGALFLAPRFGILGVAYGLVAGAILYLLVQIPSLIAAGMRYRPRLGLHDAAVRRIGRQIIPRLVGQSAVQINFIATTSFAALLAGNQIGPLMSAYQLMLLPHGIFVMSLVTVLFPQMTQLWARGEHQSFRDTAERAVRLVIFVTLPLAMALAVLRVPVIRLFYERGQFDAHSTALVAAPLLLYLSSIVAFAASEPLIRSFYAMQDTRTPVYIALVTVTLNIVLGLIVVKTTHWNAAGLAFAFSVANNLEAVLLFIFLRRRIGGEQGRVLGWAFARACICTFVMGAALLLFTRLSQGVLPFITLAGAYGRGLDAFWLLAWLGCAGLLGGGVFLGMAYVLRVPELAQVITLVRRRRSEAA